MIQAHYIWSDNVARLHRNFSKFHGGFSKFVFNAHKIEDKHGETAFGNEGWFYSLLLKTKKVVQILEQNRGKHCLILDIDIYIYNEVGLFQFLLERAEHSSFTAMQEDTRNELNGGFLWIRSNEVNRKLFKDTSRILQGYIKLPSPLRQIYLLYKVGLTKLFLADQTLLNQLVMKRKIKVDFISTKYCCWGKNQVEASHLFHHAVCTKNEKEKIDLLTHHLQKFRHINPQNSQ